MCALRRAPSATARPAAAPSRWPAPSPPCRACETSCAMATSRHSRPLLCACGCTQWKALGLGSAMGQKVRCAPLGSAVRPNAQPQTRSLRARAIATQRLSPSRPSARRASTPTQPRRQAGMGAVGLRERRTDGRHREVDKVLIPHKPLVVCRRLNRVHRARDRQLRCALAEGVGKCGRASRTAAVRVASAGSLGSRLAKDMNSWLVIMQGGGGSGRQTIGQPTTPVARRRVRDGR